MADFMAWWSRSQRRLRPAGHSWQWAIATSTLALLLAPSWLSSACPDICSCSSGDVNCMEHRMRFVPDDLPANATTILLNYNRITALRSRSFVAQKGLRRLSLRGNLLVSIHPQALAGLSELRELDLSGNFLSILSQETFFPVPNLVILNLGNNKLLRLQAELLEALPHLQALSLHGNMLGSLPEELLGAVASLHSLTLDDNPWACSCSIQPLFEWLRENAEKVSEVNTVTCRYPASLAQLPIVALGNESFARCQEPWLQVSDYAFFLLIGPLTFLASICVCILVGSLAVTRMKAISVPPVRPGALARRAKYHIR